jgi:hypothetical protein
VRIDGANHSQFGWYGFQPGDRLAEINRAEQHRLTIEAVMNALREVAQGGRSGSGTVESRGSD